MPVEDYVGVEGFCVDAKNPQDVWEALDRIHTQIIDEQEEIEKFVLPRSPEIAAQKIKTLEATLRILETAMEKLMDLEGVDPW